MQDAGRVDSERAAGRVSPPRLRGPGARRRTCAWIGALVLASLALGGCASTPVGRADLLDFLADGGTARDDARMHLGIPAAEYEGGRILAYRLSKDKLGYVRVGPGNDWAGVQYSLILIFDGDGVLSRHALVTVRAP